MGKKAPRKRIWKGDKVQVIGGSNDGLVGRVKKTEPGVGAPAKYVYIQKPYNRKGPGGLVRVPVRFVFIVEKTKYDLHKRVRNRNHANEGKQKREREERERRDRAEREWYRLATEAEETARREKCQHAQVCHSC